MFASGDRVGGYEIVRKLGEGGMGTVFLARELDTERSFAIKIAHPGASATVQQRFRQEVRVTRRLQSPHLITTYDTGVHEAGDQPVSYLVMEYLAGETLAEVLQDHDRRRAAVPLPELIDFARQIAAGLTSAHEQSIVHRDLKPSNVFVCRTGATTLVKLIDFGLALIHRETLVEDAGQTMLSPPYAPPEQWTSAAGVGPAADLYAFGCVLFELATGAPPFGVDGDLRQAHAAAAVPKVDQVRRERHPGAAPLPSELARVIQRMLAKDPRKRPSLTDVAQILARPLAPARSSPRRMLAWGLLATGLAGLLAVAIILFSRSPRAPDPDGEGPRRAATPAEVPGEPGRGVAPPGGDPGRSEPLPGRSEPLPGADRPSPAGAGSGTGADPGSTGTPEVSTGPGSDSTSGPGRSAGSVASSGTGPRPGAPASSTGTIRPRRVKAKIQRPVVTEIVAPEDGTITWRTASGTEVKPGDVVLNLQVPRSAEDEIERRDRTLVGLRAREAEAEAKVKAKDKNKDRAKANERALKDVRREMVTEKRALTAAMSRLTTRPVPSTAPGTFESSSQLKDRVSKDTKLGTVTAPPSVMFEVPASARLDPGDEARVKLGRKSLTCRVVERTPVGDGKVVQVHVRCERQPGLVEGAELEWELPPAR